MKRKTKTTEDEPGGPEDVCLQQRRGALFHALETELKIFEDTDVSDKRLVAHFQASNATLPDRLQIEHLPGNHAALVIDPSCDARQQAAIIEIAQRLTEKRGRHPLLESLRPVFLASMETFAVLDMAADLNIPEVYGLSRVYGDFARQRDLIGQKIGYQKLAAQKEAAKSSPGLQLP